MGRRVLVFAKPMIGTIDARAHDSTAPASLPTDFERTLSISPRTSNHVPQGPTSDHRAHTSSTALERFSAAAAGAEAFMGSDRRLGSERGRWVRLASVVFVRGSRFDPSSIARLCQDETATPGQGPLALLLARAIYRTAAFDLVLGRASELERKPGAGFHHSGFFILPVICPRLIKQKRPRYRAIYLRAHGCTRHSPPQMNIRRCPTAAGKSPAFDLDARGRLQKAAGCRERTIRNAGPVSRHNISRGCPSLRTCALAATNGVGTFSHAARTLSVEEAKPSKKPRVVPRAWAVAHVTRHGRPGRRQHNSNCCCCRRPGCVPRGVGRGGQPQTHRDSDAVLLRPSGEIAQKLLSSAPSASAICVCICIGAGSRSQAHRPDEPWLAMPPRPGGLLLAAGVFNELLSVQSSGWCHRSLRGLQLAMES
ncbi:hypothetical protein DENSPDRAFT_852813 [Dentipellis sp. KUC8613]|nr:hypothetical protein DENSPDRAFT_852813 [Dentipellis sp. KUC8613]